MEKIAVIGSGYVGLVTGACFAELGNKVICIDNDLEKIEMLRKGEIPIYEPGLKELILKNMRNKRLNFSNSIKEAVKISKVIFIAVGTPPGAKGEADLSAVEDVSEEIARYMDSYRIIVEKSTVPIETGRWVEYTVAAFKKKKVSFDIASNPEFLREGTAIKDFMHPDRVVLGVETKKAEKILKKLYKPLKAQILITDIKSAELIKHASNSYLAMRISFINAVSRVCDLSGADIDKVSEGMGLDKRIGKNFLKAGLGYGGFCFPKDLSAFIHICEKLGYNPDLLKAVVKVNEQQKRFFFNKIKRSLWNLSGKSIGVLGLSFKPDTDDIRLSPALDVVRMLKKEGAQVKVYDPKAIHKARKEIKDIIFCKDAYEAAKGSDCLVIATDWPQFKRMDLKVLKRALKRPIIIDGRNIFEPAKMKKLGFTYISIGRE
ncbi:MAG: UDP-glucose/GDP-mannose dehydrogenase family protein [Candidatus Omnitrophota bacterium]